MTIEELVNNEEARRHEFPVVAKRIFMAHAGVAPLPRVAVDAIHEFCAQGSTGAQENHWTWTQVRNTRQNAATLLGCSPDEIALLGPTSLGLSVIANGISWKKGEEVVFYRDDYPANVYPWKHLETQGVKAVSIQPEQLGLITWDAVEAVLTPRTRLVSVASCHFLSGYRINVDEIGKHLHDRGILFCLDAIQTLGAFPLSVEHVDFLSADSHKWMLGPAAAGIIYIKASKKELVTPTLLGSWNVVSPQFVAQETMNFEPGGRRYEPGMLNLPGIVGMNASLELLLKLGISDIEKRITYISSNLARTLLDAEFESIVPYAKPFSEIGTPPSGIVSVFHPGKDMSNIAKELEASSLVVSLRQNREGKLFIRFSPHFYNTLDDIKHIAKLLKRI